MLLSYISVPSGMTYERIPLSTMFGNVLYINHLTDHNISDQLTKCSITKT